MPELTPPESQLAQATDRLYQELAIYRGKPNWDDPLDNKSQEDNLSVTRFTVRKLPLEHFKYYGWHSVALCGGETVALKYFFPRVLSEAANPVTPSPSIPLEMYIDYLNKRDWLEWPEPERRVIADFFYTWFEASLADPHFMDRYERHADRVLRFAAFAQVDIALYLANWAQNESVSATIQLALFVRNHENTLLTRATLDGWIRTWLDAGVSSDRIAQVARFLTSRRTYSRLERAFFDATDPHTQQILSAAVASLRNAYSAWHQNLRGTGLIPRWAESIAEEMSYTP